MIRDNALRMMIPARLDYYLRLHHRSGIGTDQIGYKTHSPGLKAGGYGSSVEDMEVAADAYAVGVLDGVWWAEVPQDSRLAIEVAMGWLPSVVSLRRGIETALLDGVEILTSGLRKHGVSV